MSPSGRWPPPRRRTPPPDSGWTVCLCGAVARVLFQVRWCSSEACRFGLYDRATAEEARAAGRLLPPAGGDGGEGV